MDIRWLVRLLLTFSSTSWMLVIFIIKTHFTVWGLPGWVFSLICIFCAILLSYGALQFTKLLDIDELGELKEISLADNDYIPVYLGYFFVSLSIADGYTLFFVYTMVLILLTMLDMYFNPIFIFWGYHYYHVVTSEGTRAFVIIRSNERNPKNISGKNIRRLNNWTFISHTGE